MNAIRTMLHKLRRSERGATAIEYGLICALIVIAMMAGLSKLGGGVNGSWGKLESNVASHM